ncbi:uncharacterized protein LOC144471186 isoform X2 [Augochlora pura]
MKPKDVKKHGKKTRIRTEELEARGVHMDMKTSWAAQELTAKYTNLDEMARFQQKQLQEKEQKLLQLYDQQQQRAYQVVQRGSAGSNGSSYGSSVSQHTVTKTSSSSHTTSTSQGGKVRQMFDERRQTTVKGIDRSYPLEPLENKPRKQANGNAGPRNGNAAVSRQSVTLKRVVRADVNSNVNAGKPIVSYHEEIGRESSFGSPGRQQLDDDDEFGNENHVARYANGNHRDEIEEVLDDDTIERNRMMAKLHLMEYDETLKHRIKNDLESEEFPEDFMVDVPDKLPKQSISKKLSQAEARLERFRNANAKRVNNAARSTGPPSHVPKKRADAMLPGKAASSRDRKAPERLEEMLSSSDSERYVKRGMRGSRFSRDQSQRSAIDDKARKSRLSPESLRDGRSTSPKLFCGESEKFNRARSSPNYLEHGSKGVKFSRRESGKSATGYMVDSVARSSSEYLMDRSGSPKFFGKESGRSATTVDSKMDIVPIGRLSPQFLKGSRSRSESPNLFNKELRQSATNYASDVKTRLSPEFSSDRSRSGSPKFFCKESEKSATTYAIDAKGNIRAKIIGRSSPDFSKDRSRSTSPKFFCKESEKSATTYAIDTKGNISAKVIGRSSPDFSKDRSRSTSPKFFCKESEKSATTYAIDSKAAKSSADYLKLTRPRSGSPKFFCKESEKSATTYAIDARSKKKLDIPKNRSIVKIEPDSEFVTRISTKSPATVDDTVDRFIKDHELEQIRTPSPTGSAKSRAKFGAEIDLKSSSRSGSPDIFERLAKERSASPRFRESKRFSPTLRTPVKGPSIASKSPDPARSLAKHHRKVSSDRYEFSSAGTTPTRSPEFRKPSSRKSSASPQFVSDRSATIMFVTPETITKTGTGYSRTGQKSLSPTFSIGKRNGGVASRFVDSERRDSPEDVAESSKRRIRSSVSRYFLEQCERASRSAEIGARSAARKPKVSRNVDSYRVSSPVSLKHMDTVSPVSKSPPRDGRGKIAALNADRSGTPEFFCYETDKMATTVSLRPSKESTSPARPEGRASKSPDVLTSIKKVSDAGSKSSVYMTDGDKRILRLFHSKDDHSKPSKGFLRKHSKSPSPTTFSKTKSPKNYNVNRDVKSSSRRNTPSTSPEFFCYETDKMATTVSLKPRPLRDYSVSPSRDYSVSPSRDYSTSPSRDYSVSPSRNYSASPEPARSESRLSKRTDIFTSGRSVDGTSRSSSPVLGQYVIDSGRSSTELFSSKSDKPKSPKDLARRHSKSPLSSDTFSKSSGKPEFFCYETDKMATTVSLKPRPSNDSGDYSKSPVGSKSRLSISPDIRVIDDSRSSSPVLSRYIKDDDRATQTKSPKDQPRQRNKTPTFTGTYSKGKSSVLNLPKNAKPTASRSPDFFCYETEKMATTVSWKPRPSNDSGDYSKSPQRPPVSPDISSSPLLLRYATDDRATLRQSPIKSPKDQLRQRNKTPPYTGTYSKGKSPRTSNVLNLPRDAKSVASRSPDFFSRETEKSVATVSSRRGSTNSKNAKHAELRAKGRPPKSPEQSAKEGRGAGRRGSGNVLRSTGLIRDIIKHQRNRESDSTLSKTVERESRSKDEFIGDVCLRGRELVTTQSETRSFAKTTSEIAVAERYAKRGGTYSKSSRTSPTDRKKNRRAPLDSDAFCPSRTDRGVVLDGRIPSPRESVFRGAEDIPGEDPAETLGSGKQTASLSRRAPTLGSIELVRKVMGGGARAAVKTLKTQEPGSGSAGGIQRRRSNSGESGATEVNDGGSSSKNYERTDSVESALRRFDSIDAENGAEPVPDASRRSEGSPAERRQTEESRAESFEDDSTTISLKALGARSSGIELSAARSKRKSSEPACRAAKEEDRSRKRIAKGGDSSETAGRDDRALACRRKLFRDTDSAERARSRRDKGGEQSGSAGSRRANRAGSATGMSEEDGSPSMRHLRSIEDIRRSIEDTSSSCRGQASRSAVASNASRGEGKPRASSRTVACDRVGRQVVQARRAESLAARRTTERFAKSATRFSRVAKSPSLESTKPAEASGRPRRSVLSPQSKSPDMANRRPSMELKGSDARSSKRTTPTKDAEPTGIRKTTARKSTDTVDGATVLENGLHSQDQTVETKHDNELHTAKKTLVVDDDEQPPKENNGPLTRKPLLKRPSIDKQTPSAPMQASSSAPKSKMTLKSKTPNVASSSSRSSASSKSGSNCTPDLLVPCKICGRSFAQDRVGLHEQICTKTGQKKRKLFDSVMFRVKGTELEKFVKKGCAKKQQPEKPAETKTNWRRKHEDFINAIRSAKQVQAHLAAGGKLSDLPPPPPSDTSDYIQCPHCGRKFNKPAADRHIPKCEHMLHNKPVHNRAPKPRR